MASSSKIGYLKEEPQFLKRNEKEPFRVAELDWDKGNRKKCQKHGVSIPEIKQIFRNAPRIAPDLKHSDEEDRFIAAGRTDEGRPVFVAFTIRTKKRKRFLRPISARYMHAKEIATYEKESAKTKNGQGSRRIS